MTHQQVTNVRFQQGRSGRINHLVNQHFSFSISYFSYFTSLRFHFRLNAAVSHNKLRPQLNKESQMKLPLARRVRRFTTEMIATQLQGCHFHQPNSSGLPHSKKNLYRDIELVGDSCRFMVTTKGSVTHAPLI